MLQRFFSGTKSGSEDSEASKPSKAPGKVTVDIVDVSLSQRAALHPSFLPLAVCRRCRLCRCKHCHHELP
jgi:hypothetical protein